ncbi:MAG: succinate dehydrogenase assembly factor 4 [Pseudomonadota bacterium]
MSDDTSDMGVKRDLPAAAQRALAEAEERRAAEKAVDRAREIDGRRGPEPTRYGDWENKGIASDF